MLVLKFRTIADLKNNDRTGGNKQQLPFCSIFAELSKNEIVVHTSRQWCKTC